MSHARMRRAALCIAPLILGSHHPSLARAQELRQVTVALVATLPDSTALASIIRSPAPNSHTTILLRERDANIETLASAMSTVDYSRRTHGDAPSMELVINLHGRKRPESLTPNERRLGALYLTRLRAAKIDQIDRVGRVRATQIALTPLRRQQN